MSKFDVAALIAQNNAAKGRENVIESAQRIIAAVQEKGVKSQGYNLRPAFSGPPKPPGGKPQSRVLKRVGY